MTELYDNDATTVVNAELARYDRRRSTTSVRRRRPLPHRGQPASVLDVLPPAGAGRACCRRHSGRSITAI